MESIWMKNYVDKKLPSIIKNDNTSVLIIGGGIAGLMCAYNLMKSDIKFILVDRGKIAGGVSANTTAQVSIAHDSLYDEISKKHNEEKAIAYLKSQMEGLNIIREIIKAENINCDYKEESTILCADEEKNVDVLNKQYQLIKYFCNVKFLNPQKDILKWEKAVEFKNQFIFNPMKYMMGIYRYLKK